MKGRRGCQTIPIALLVLLGLAAGAVSSGCSDAASEEQAASLEVVDVAAYWAVRGKDREGNNYIHPVVRFRIRNDGTKPAGYIQVMAVFKRESLPDEPWGNDFLYSISDEALPPGGTSDLLTMRSDTNFISKDSPEQMFQNEKWEEVTVQLFLRVGPSSWKPALERVVPKQIGAPGVEKFLEPESEPPKGSSPSPARSP